MMKIPYYDLRSINRSFGDELSKAVSRVSASGWYLHGNEVEHFEHQFAEYVGVRHCIGVGNGLDALTAVLMAWKQMSGWNDGDEVILPANTFIATALAVSRSGLKPVLCDCHIELPTIDETQIEHYITPKTRVIIPVHLYGLICNMDTIRHIANRHHLKVLEDACQAHGSLYFSEENNQLTTLFGRRAGNCGDAAAFSFYPGKNLGCMGDGGAVTTNDSELMERVRAITNYGQTSKYLHQYEGFNSRLDELQAAVLSVKLERLDHDNLRRAEIAHYYSTHISHPAVQLLPPVIERSHVYHIYSIKCTSRKRLIQLLQEQGIETLIHYPRPIHRQKAYQDYASLRFPAAEAWAENELSLPVSPLLTNEEIKSIVDCINQNIF